MDIWVGVMRGSFIPSELQVCECCCSLCGICEFQPLYSCQFRRVLSSTDSVTGKLIASRSLNVLYLFPYINIILYTCICTYFYIFIYTHVVPPNSEFMTASHRVILLLIFSTYALDNTWSRAPSGLKYQSSIGVDHSLYMEFFFVFVYDMIPIANV